jgi:hypothetical protein
LVVCKCALHPSLFSVMKALAEWLFLMCGRRLIWNIAITHNKKRPCALDTST